MTSSVEPTLLKKPLFSLSHIWDGNQMHGYGCYEYLKKIVKSMAAGLRTQALGQDHVNELNL